MQGNLGVHGSVRQKKMISDFKGEKNPDFCHISAWNNDAKTPWNPGRLFYPSKPPRTSRHKRTLHQPRPVEAIGELNTAGSGKTPCQKKDTSSFMVGIFNFSMVMLVFGGWKKWLWKKQRGPPKWQSSPTLGITSLLDNRRVLKLPQPS